MNWGSHFLSILVFFLASGCTSEGPEASDAAPIALERADIGLRSDYGTSVHPDSGWHPDSDAKWPATLCFDMESGSERTSSKQAHGGTRSWKMGPEEEYGPRISRRVGDVADELHSIMLECWVWSPAEDPRLTLVITLVRGNEELSWWGKELQRHDHRPHSWTVLRGQQLARDMAQVEPDDSLVVMLWKRSSHEVLVDDLCISYRSTKPLGFQPRHRTHERLPFASVNCVTPSRSMDRTDTTGLLSKPVAIRPGSPYHLHMPKQSAIGYLVDHEHQLDTIALVRPFCPGSGDLAARERSFIKPDEDGLRMIGFDLDVNGEISNWTEVIVHISPPVP